MSPNNIGGPVSEHDALATPQDARARAKADKAYRKAMRPWFKKKRFIIPAILIVLIALGAALGGGNGNSADTATTSAGAPGKQQAADPAAAGIGTAVRDGGFEFTVTKVQDRGAKIGSGALAETAQGKFISVQVDVKNIGNEPKMLDASSQKLTDTQGRQFNTSHAFGALPDASKVFLENINPGNSVNDAPLLFDVPKDVKIDSIELHDSPFSGGVKVSLK